MAPNAAWMRGKIGKKKISFLVFWVFFSGHFLELISLTFLKLRGRRSMHSPPFVFGKTLQAAPGMGKVRAMSGLPCDLSAPAGARVDSGHFTWWHMYFLESGKHRRAVQHSLGNLNLSDSFSGMPVLLSKT